MGRTLGFFESVPFFQMGSRPWAFMGSVALTCVCVFQSDLSTLIRVSLIVVPDNYILFILPPWVWLDLLSTFVPTPF